VPGLKMASAPLMPSWWTAEGIMECSRGNVARGLAFLGVLVSNAMVMALAVQSLGAATFYSSLQRVLTAPGDSRRRKMLFPRLERLLGVLSHDIRAITMKDIRTFFRDPVQWSQALIFFGLLALYFGSIRSFNYHELPDTWRNLITFLNVFSVAAVQCSLASRFIFPQLSLEGHAFWLLGLSPITPRRILWTKFMLAAAALLAVSVSLMSLSTGMLRVLPAVRWIAVGITASISLFVAALSTGLGAVFLDLRQPNPTAIVSGLGGTINLVLSLLYMLLVIVPFGLIFHLAFMGHMAMDRLNTALLGAGVCVALLTVVGTAIPLWMGHRSLAARDF